MCRTRTILSFLFLSLHAVFADAAGNNSEMPSLRGNWGADARIGYGFLIAHREALMPLQQAHLKSAEIAIFRTTRGEKPWEQQFLSPEKGFQLEVIDPGSPGKLGTAVALYPFVDFPLQQHERRAWWFRYGMGIGYVEKVFDAATNYKNAAIGSHINGVLHFDVQYRQVASDYAALCLGVGLTHFSNGSTRMPNLGINLPKVTLSYRRYFGDEPVSIHQRPAAPRNRGNIQAYVAAGRKETYPALGENYTAATVDVLYAFESKRRSNFGLGVDVFYDQSLSVRQERLTGASSSAADFRTGIYGAWQMRLGDIGIAFNMGFYPYTIYKEDGNFYHRIGFRYYLGNLFICSNLKTHYARADFIEWGIGWQFDKKQPAR